MALVSGRTLISIDGDTFVTTWPTRYKSLGGLISCPILHLPTTTTTHTHVIEETWTKYLAIVLGTLAIPLSTPSRSRAAGLPRL